MNELDMLASMATKGRQELISDLERLQARLTGPEIWARDANTGSRADAKGKMDLLQHAFEACEQNIHRQRNVVKALQYELLLRRWRASNADQTRPEFDKFSGETVEHFNDAPSTMFADVKQLVADTILAS